jgi:DNA-binding IclR family transcriptional regulator
MSQSLSAASGDDRDAPATGASARVVALLEAVAAAESSIGVREIARLTGIDKSAVSRLLAQLQRLGVVDQAQGLQGRYTVGPRLFMISSMVAARDSLLVAARPILRALVEEVDETCYLSTLEHDGYVFRDKVDCNKPIRYFLEMGRAMPLNAGAGGRAVLAGMGPEQAAATVHRVPLERLTDKTVTDPDVLLRMAEEDRGRGWSVSIGERLVGGSAIAAPYFDGDGSCRGALVLAIPSERLEQDRIPELGSAVAGAARELSARLGHGASWQAGAAPAPAPAP